MLLIYWFSWFGITEICEQTNKQERFRISENNGTKRETASWRIPHPTFQLIIIRKR